MTASVRILSTSSVDSSPAILLIAPDGSKILVNCAEGCQRNILEFSQKVSTLRAVCLTHLSHSSIGGLPGMILTTADVAEASMENFKNLIGGSDKFEEDASPNGIELIGPAGTQQFMHSLRHFMRREKFVVRVQEGKVENVQPAGVQRRRKRSKKDSIEPTGFFSINSIPFRQEVILSSCKKRPHSERRHEQQLMSYVFTTPAVPGKFMPDKAAALGVPKGPLFGELKSGHAVTFTDASGQEKTVQSYECVSAPSPGTAILVLYYPTNEIGKEILDSKAFDCLLEGQNENVVLELVIHLSPDASMITQFSEYWKKKQTDSHVEHVFLSTSAPDWDGTPFRSAAMGALSRSLLCKEIYRVPRPAMASNTEVSQDYRIGRTMMEYVLMPRSRKGFAELSLPAPDEQEARELVEHSGAATLSQEVLKELDTPKESEMLEGELIFTGTGSAIPCKHRNVTGMSLRTANGHSMLLDVGEGTIGQILRLQSDTNRKQSLADIKAVWISHPHADHHLGILRLLHDRRALDPLLVFAPTPLLRFLQEYVKIDPSIQDTYIPFDCKDLIIDEGQPEARERLQEALGFTDIRTIPVAHCPHSFALILDGTPFGTVVYSGDCRPSNRLANSARGADVLIHEATFEDGMEAEATLKRHSTVGEALGVAHLMQAKCTILTHFSQRYPRIPPTPAETQGSMPVIFAFDYMCLKPWTLLAASKLVPALRLLYPEEDDNNGTKSSASASASAAEATLSTPGLFAQSNIL